MSSIRDTSSFYVCPLLLGYVTTAFSITNITQPTQCKPYVHTVRSFAHHVMAQ